MFNIDKIHKPGKIEKQKNTSSYCCSAFNFFRFRHFINFIILLLLTTTAAL